MSAPVMPPEEKFWQRYSPHNEFSLSGVGTLTVYLLFGLLILGGVKLSGLLAPAQDFSMGAVAADFEEGDGGRGSEGAAGREAVEPSRIQQPAVPPTVSSLPLPKPPAGEVVPEVAPPKSEEANLDELTEDLKKRFGNIGDSVPGIFGPPRGENRPGKPGTPKPGNLENKSRIEAMQRWNMVFDTKNGDDYRKQLESLGAFLVYRAQDGQFRVIRKLAPPAQPGIEDLQKLERIFWWDDNPQSVRNLAGALMLPEVPARIAAFFPPELEHKLAGLEKKFAGNRPLANIRETRFRILLNRQGIYEPVVVDQR
jgi:hypothetical protein